MHIQYDLHTHSVWSDGDHTPEVVASIAHTKRLKGVVLSDHDTLAGWAVFAKTLRGLGLETIQGIEISSLFEDTDIHILGYSLNFRISVLQPLIKKLKRAASERMEAVAKKLARAHIAKLNLTALDRKKGSVAHLSKYDLIKELVWGHGIPFQDAQTMIERGGLAYTPYNPQAIPSPKTVIELIHRAGGIAVFAHPGEMLKRTSNTPARAKIVMQNAIQQLIAYSIDGIEVYTPRHSPDQINEFLNLARIHNLIVTGGSDFHGAIHAPQRPVGSGGIDAMLWKQFIKRLREKT